MTPPPDQFAVREAMQRLSDPERRLIDELFWFWPHSQGETASDAALSHLREGKDKEAEGIWLEQEAEHSESSVSTHNLALLYHFRALDSETELLQAAPGSIQVDALAKMWDKSFRRWRSLSEQEGFWSRLTMRIRELEDPRLTSGTGRRIRTALPSALLSICGQLALQATEAGRKESASRLVDIINSSGFAEADIKDSLRTAIEPVRNRIKTLCKAAELASENDPVHADATCQQLLSNAKPLLEGLDCLLPAGHPTREVAHDDVAERVLRCQVAFANKTSNWKLSAILLQSALPVATSEFLRKKLQENIEIVRKHADTNDDFCGEGYYDAPAPLLEQMEKARAFSDRQNHDQAVQCLEDLLAGKTEVRVSAEHVALVNEALAYCLGCRAARRLNEVIGEWNDVESSVITAIRGRVKQIADTAWRCAMMQTIPQYTVCPCMACGTVIYGRYSVLKWTFNKSTGAVNLIICGSCTDRHRAQMNSHRTKLKATVQQSAQDYVEAGKLDPANKFVQEQAVQMRKMCSDVGIPMPSPQRHKVKAAKASASWVPATAASATALEGWSLGLGIFSLVWFFFCNDSDLAFFAVPTAVAAMICGHLALSRMKLSGENGGRGKVATGLVLGYGVLLVTIISGTVRGSERAGNEAKRLATERTSQVPNHKPSPPGSNASRTASGGEPSIYSVSAIRWGNTRVVGPAAGRPGETLTLLVEGNNFGPRPTLSFGTSGISVVSYSKVAKNGIGAKIAIAPSAAPGLYDVIVTSPDARQARSTASFEVRSAPPQPVSTRRAQNSKDAATASTANTVSISPKEQERQIRAAITEGDVLKKLGDYDGAIAAYRKGLQADPADAEVRERIRRAQNAKDAEAAVSKH